MKITKVKDIIKVNKITVDNIYPRSNSNNIKKDEAQSE